MNRREFIRFGAATLATAAVPGAMSAFAHGAGAPRLRIGILSDTHLDGGAAAAQKLERAFSGFRKGRVDAILICGDLADNGVEPQLEELVRIWEKVFPDSKGLDGEPVERLFHCGDHDNRGHWMLDGKEGDDVRRKYGWTEEQLAANACFAHPKETWERVFGEPWAPIVHKRVKGYDFILSHYTKRGWKCAEGLDDFLKGFKPDPAKPFFYSQHRVLRNTVCGPGVWGQDDGAVGRLLSAYPNCCAFCGHSHQTAAREDAIWQGAFTAVQVPSLKYVTREAGHENKPNGYLAEQGMLLDVWDDRMTLHRLDFANQKPLGPSWTIPLVGAARPFAHETRRRAAKIPEFPEGARLEAKIEEKVGGDGIPRKTLSLSFPVVNGRAGGVRAYDYEVAVHALCFGGDVARNVRRYFSPKCDFAPSAEAEKVEILFPLDGFKTWNALKSPTYGAIHVEVRPRETFGGVGRALVADVKASGKIKINA